jgi:hypothetical protein
MSEDRTAVGRRLWRQERQEPSARLFVPADQPTLAWLAQRANGRPFGEVAADVLKTLAEAETRG